MAEIQITRDGSTVTIAPSVNIVTSTVAQIRSEIKALMAEGYRALIIDLKGVEAVDSTGIGLLIAVHNTLKKEGGTMTITNASKHVLALFNVMRLIQHFSVTGA